MAKDERYHPLVEGTSAAVFVFDANRILYINPAARKLTYMSARELMARPFTSLLHPSFRNGFASDAPLTTPVHEQVKLVRADEEERWVELWLQPILFRGAAVSLATAFDIHALKEADLARREAEVQLKLVQRAGRTVNWDWRVSNDELTVYGVPGNLLTPASPVLTTTGTAFFNYVAPDDLVRVKQGLRDALEDRSPLLLEFELHLPNGERMWLIVRGQVIGDKPGRPRHVVGVATDVTQRRRAEQALAREQEQTLAVLASISDGVIRTDTEGRVVDLSGPASELLGIPSDQARGRSLGDLMTLLDEDSGAPLPDPIQECLRSDAPGTSPRRCLLRRPKAEEMPVRFHTALLRDHESKATGVVMVLRDLNEQRTIDRGMVYLATHDPLTDLVNRPEFERKLGNALAEATRLRRQDSLMFLDIDSFKLINDTCGHPAGDKMLKQVASFLKCRFRDTDTLGRIGGDKFGVLLESCSPQQARELVEKLYRDLRTFRFEWEGTSLPVSLSTGLVGLGPDESDVEQALGAAQTACSLAKRQGGDRYYEYEGRQEFESRRDSQLEVLQRIQDALTGSGFELHGQLIQPLGPGESSPRMYEILLRMRERDGRLVLPDQFLPVARRHRVVSAIDRWVLTSCLEVIASLPDGDDSLFTINVSGQSLGDDRFLEFVLHELSYRGIEPSAVYFEITETATFDNFDKAQRFVTVLRGRGCGFVLDDFGSGLSSFSYLRNFPVDFIKIDGQFIQGISKDPTQRALVESINHLGHIMNIKTIAEAVENQETLEAVREMKVDYAQGLGISHPGPLIDLLSPQRAAQTGR